MTDDAHGETRQKFRFMFAVINGAMYVLLFLLYCIDYFELGSDRAFRGVKLQTNAEMAIMCLDTFLYVALIVAFFCLRTAVLAPIGHHCAHVADAEAHFAKGAVSHLSRYACCVWSLWSRMASPA